MRNRVGAQHTRQGLSQAGLAAALGVARQQMVRLCAQALAARLTVLAAVVGFMV
jgi:DNA-binding XRE family transcriptional regulator